MSNLFSTTNSNQPVVSVEDDLEQMAYGLMDLSMESAEIEEMNAAGQRAAVNIQSIETCVTAMEDSDGMSSDALEALDFHIASQFEAMGAPADVYTKQSHGMEAFGLGKDSKAEETEKSKDDAKTGLSKAYHTVMTWLKRLIAKIGLFLKNFFRMVGMAESRLEKVKASLSESGTWKSTPKIKPSEVQRDDNGKPSFSTSMTAAIAALTDSTKQGKELPGYVKSAASAKTELSATVMPKFKNAKGFGGYEFEVDGTVTWKKKDNLPELPSEGELSKSDAEGILKAAGQIYKALKDTKDLASNADKARVEVDKAFIEGKLKQADVSFLGKMVTITSSSVPSLAMAVANAGVRSVIDALKEVKKAKDDK